MNNHRKQKSAKEKTDHTRDDSLHNEKQRLKCHEIKKQKSTNIEDIANDDVLRYLDQNFDDMNVQNQTQEEIEPGMYKYCKFV